LEIKNPGLKKARARRNLKFFADDAEIISFSLTIMHVKASGEYHILRIKQWTHLPLLGNFLFCSIAPIEGFLNNSRDRGGAIYQIHGKLQWRILSIQ
jgi:hypothetical protein